MTLTEFNKLSDEDARRLLTDCCGASAWNSRMMKFRPFSSMDELHRKAEECFRELESGDWLEAFRHHPKIGDLESLKKKFASTSHWAGSEQSGVNIATEEVLQRLASGNDAYEKRFGFIFIVCATGKSASEMLELLEQRIGNDSATELAIAAAEQQKITTIRIDKLFA